MHLDLKKIHFGKRLSRHILYEETDNQGAGWAKGIYFALAAESGGGFIGGPMAGPKGFAMITPTYAGKDLEYTYSATTSVVAIETAKGSIRLAIDGSKVLRVNGSGIGMRINGRLGFGGIAIMTKRGIEITLGGSIYLIASHKGKMSLDCHWDLKGLRSTDPIITLDPDESGIIDLALYDMDDAYELPLITNSFDQCVAASESDFNAFASGLIKSTAINGSLHDFCSYAIWTGFQKFKGKELVPSNKMTDMNIYSIEQPVVAMPFTDPSRAIDILIDTLGFATPMGMVPAWFAERQNLNEAVPPIYAFTVSRLLSEGQLDKISGEKLSVFYNLMSKAITWWLKNRSNDKGVVYYAYRHECNWPKEKIYGAGMPCASPDLAAYIILASDSLAKIADMLGKPDEAALWNSACKKQLDILINTLWKGSGFTSVNTLTGDSAPAEGMLALMPLILGKRLPGEIINALTVKVNNISFKDAPVIPAALIILGLKISGKDTVAKTAAEALLGSCVSGANDMRGTGINAGSFFSPAACAALLMIGKLS